MRIHVTGATGFLGSRARCGSLPGATRRARSRLRDAARACVALFERLRPDVVIHTAYRQDGEGAREIVVDGSENVARAAAAVGARLVHLSTDVVFDGRKGAPVRRGRLPCARAPTYGRAKAEAETRVAAAHPDALDRPDVADRRRAGARAVEARARRARPAR